MKKLILLSVLILGVVITSYSQKINTSNTRTFENIETHLYRTEIIKLDTSKVSTLKNKFKNVASILFANLKQAIVSETSNQIVLNYVIETKTRPSTYWNVRLVAQFKVGKMRLQIYDEGNVFIPSGQYTPKWPEGSLYVTNNKRVVKRLRVKTLNEWMDENDTLLKEIKEGMIRKNDNNDW